MSARPSSSCPCDSRARRARLPRRPAPCSWIGSASPICGVFVPRICGWGRGLSGSPGPMAPARRHYSRPCICSTEAGRFAVAEAGPSPQGEKRLPRSLAGCATASGSGNTAGLARREAQMDRGRRLVVLLGLPVSVSSTAIRHCGADFWIGHCSTWNQMRAAYGRSCGGSRDNAMLGWRLVAAAGRFGTHPMPRRSQACGRGVPPSSLASMRPFGL